MRLGWRLLTVVALTGCGEELPRVAERLEVERVHAPGYVEPEGRLRRLGFADPGVIMAMNVGVGAAVERGELLARLESEVEEARLEVALAEWKKAEAELKSLEAGPHPGDLQTLAAAVAAWEVVSEHFDGEALRLRRLEGEAVAAREVSFFRFFSDFSTAWLERVRSELEAEEKRVREVDLAVGKARVEVAEAHVEVARQKLRQRQLRAPAAGRVLEVIGSEGERGDGGSVIVFAPVGPSRVRVEIDEGFVGLIREGQRAVIESPSGERAKGLVSRVKQVMGDKSVFIRDARERMDTQVFEAWIDFQDEPPEWPFGLEVRVEIDVCM